MTTAHKRLRGSAIALTVLSGVAGVGVAAGGAARADEFSQVRYEVTGPAVAQTLTYQLDTGQRHIVNVPLPWSTSFTGYGGQTFVLSAEAPGSVTCRITVNGNVVSNNTAKGAPARTVCST
jgi:hypothetical protein